MFSFGKQWIWVLYDWTYFKDDIICIRAMCMFDKFHWSSTSNRKCHMTFSKTNMNINWHLHFLLKCHLNVTCLVAHVIPISKVSIDVWFICFTSHTTCQILNYACQLTWILFLCKFLCVKCQKLAKTLLKIYTASEWHSRSLRK